MNGIFLGIVASSGGSGGGSTYTAINGYYNSFPLSINWCTASPTTVYVPVGGGPTINDVKNANRPIYSDSALTILAPKGWYGDSNSPSQTGTLFDPARMGGPGWIIGDTQTCTPIQYTEIPAYFAFSSPNYCVPGPSGLSVYVTSSAGVTTILDARNGGIPIFSDSGFVSSASAGYYGDNISTGYEWNGTAWGINVANCP